jgi:DNA-binding HxlR family transcriptional regulator
MHFLVHYALKAYHAHYKTLNFGLMAKNLVNSPAQCAVDYAFQRIGGKYKGRLIAYLRYGATRYGQLRRHLPDVTPKMLTQALRELEADQLVSRQVYLEVPPRVEYSLTPSGEELLPFIELLNQWGARQMALHGIAPVAEHPDSPVCL